METATHPRRALVLGVNGQDGSYLAEHLLDQGWVVCGVGRQTASRWVVPAPTFKYVCLDLSDVPQLAALTQEYRPDAIYHVAAVHGSAGFQYESRWQDVHLVNTVSAHAVLEYLRVTAPHASLVYASSSKVFGDPLPLQISESSPRHSNCIYSTTKNAATDLIRYYRARHQTKASVVWTFNHESPRRGSSYFIPRIVETLASAILDRQHIGKIGALGFWSDWGDASEFMDTVACIANQPAGCDFVLASGKTLWATDFVEILFKKYGLLWTDHLLLATQEPLERPPQWSADISAVQQATGKAIARTVYDVCEDILRQNHPAAWAQVAPHGVSK